MYQALYQEIPKTSCSASSNSALSTVCVCICVFYVSAFDAQHLPREMYFFSLRIE